MDKELDDLLDSALDDFNKEVKIEKKNATESDSNAQLTEIEQGKVTIEKTELYVDDVDYEDRPRLIDSISANASGSSSRKEPENIDEQMKLFDEIFNDTKTRETMKQFTNALSSFKDGDESKLMENFGRVMSQLTSENLNLDDEDDDDDADLNPEMIAKKLEGLNFFKKLASESTSATKSVTAKSNNSESTSENNTTSQKTHMDKVLEDMQKSSEKILNEDSVEAAASFKSLLSQLTSGLDDDSTAAQSEENASADKDGSGEEDDKEATMMMEPILNMLFSKDILYPSLKLMLDNYDKYIDERKASMSEDEMKKCIEQKQCIFEMCQVYEAMRDDDAKEAKNESLKKILDLLEKCGMPPNELVPEVNPFDILENQTNKPGGCPIS